MPNAIVSAAAKRIIKRVSQAQQHNGDVMSGLPIPTQQQAEILAQEAFRGIGDEKGSVFKQNPDKPEEWIPMDA